VTRSLAAAICIAMVATSAAAQDAAPVLIREPAPANRQMPSLSIPAQAAEKVGRQVWLNETGGNRDMITAWNRGEDFASVGIGHFIWFPAGLETPFAESFPKVAKFLRQRGAKLPGWIDKPEIPALPWRTRAEFMREFRSHRMVELRTFLLATVGLQAQYLAQRMQEALPKMLATLSDARERAHVRNQFIRVAKASPDLYPLIDYVNFKGEGIAPTETFPDKKTGKAEGWGLKHVLLAMKGDPGDTKGALDEFSEATNFVLTRRAINNPPSRRWLNGWRKRCETYRRPLR
jgi:hypothetical protein